MEFTISLYSNKTSPTESKKVIDFNIDKKAKIVNYDNLTPAQKVTYDSIVTMVQSLLSV